LIFFFLALTLLIGIICKEINKRSGIPYASLILIVGMSLSLFNPDNILGQSSTIMMNMDPQSLYFIFIPLLVFESGYNSDLFMFKKCLKPIFLLAVPGVLLCSLGFGGALYYLGFNSVPISGLFVIGALLGSTDPIAVSAMLKELGTPKKLSMLIEGESLINDGTSIICFGTFLQIFTGQDISVLHIFLKTITLCVGGPIFGLIAGFLFFWWMESIANDGVLLVSLSFANCFLIFFLCEGLKSNLSGILAIVMSSILLSYKGKIKLYKSEIYHVVETIWQFAQYVAETFLFLITGLFIAKEFRSLLNENYSTGSVLVYDLLKLVCFFFIMNFIRFLVCLIFLPCMNDEDNNTEYKITVKECVVIAYSGIRGAFPLIICLFIARNEQYDVRFRTLTTLVTIIVIAMGLLFNGMTMKFLIKNLNVVKENAISIRVRNLIKKEILVQSFEKLKSLKNCKEFQMTNWGLVADLTINNQYLRKNFMESSVDSQSFSKIGSNDWKEIFTEIRVRMIFMIKNQIYTNLAESSCSSESATVLLEVKKLIRFVTHLWKTLNMAYHCFIIIK
jgi:NhaP-type Na+/H+ or K+/H+ antiporter